MTSAKEAQAAYTTALARVVLAAAVESTPYLGRPPSESFLVALLTASGTCMGFHRQALATFGVLGSWRKIAVEPPTLNEVAHELLDRVRGRPGLVLTAEGRKVLDGELSS